LLPVNACPGHFFRRPKNNFESGNKASETYLVLFLFQHFSIPSPGSGGNFTGFLTLGETPTICNQIWTIVDEVDNPEMYNSQWNFNLDK
jgi:hypothetical protein